MRVGDEKFACRHWSTEISPAWRPLPSETDLKTVDARWKIHGANGVTSTPHFPIRREGVKEEDWRPAAIFNSCHSQETGEPLAFSTTAWVKRDRSRKLAKTVPARRNFYTHVPGKRFERGNCRCVLPPAFLLQRAPAARPDSGALDDFHMIDGGYYDNYGISNLIAWLNEGLLELQADCEKNASSLKEKPDCQKTILPPILVLQIRSFPADEEAPRAKRGWAFQLYAPIKGLGATVFPLHSWFVVARGAYDVRSQMGTRRCRDSAGENSFCDV